MKLNEAIIESRKQKKRLKSNSLRMYEQSAKTLMYWLFCDPKTDKESIRVFNYFLNATDWEVDK